MGPFNTGDCMWPFNTGDCMGPFNTGDCMGPFNTGDCMGPFNTGDYMGPFNTGDCMGRLDFIMLYLFQLKKKNITLFIPDSINSIEYKICSSNKKYYRVVYNKLS